MRNVTLPLKRTLFCRKRVYGIIFTIFSLLVVSTFYMQPVAQTNIMLRDTHSVPDVFTSVFSRRHSNTKTTPVDTTLTNSSPQHKLSRSRLLCLILTRNGNDRKVKAVNDTWAKRCDTYFFVYGNALKTHTVTLNKTLHISTPEGRSHLTAKVRRMFEYVYLTYNDSFDWILKCDDDTYVIVENLKFFLSHADPRNPLYTGYHMKTAKTKQSGYMSGGAGYIISYKALTNMVHNGFKNHGCLKDGGDEDVEIGLCLTNSSVQIVRSLDLQDRETFHPVNLREFYVPPLPVWLRRYAWNHIAKFGPGCCSNFSISFHHMAPADFYIFDHLLYKTVVYDKSRHKHIHVFNGK